MNRSEDREQVTLEIADLLGMWRSAAGEQPMRWPTHKGSPPGHKAECHLAISEPMSSSSSAPQPRSVCSGPAWEPRHIAGTN